MGEPKRGYTNTHPPFEAGNLAAAKHGAFSLRSITAGGLAVRAALFERCPWMVADVDDEALERYCRAEARARMLDEYIQGVIEQRGVEAVKPYLFSEARGADANAQKFAQDLGLDPAGRSRIARDIGMARKLFEPEGNAITALGIQGRKLRQLRGRA
ncbi:MAG: hypothetical protein JWM85_2112 [Acidimicrobiaceae bacterium]|nr:hypothetical protein [Acidimicrobiaceae bacterium]